MAAPWENDPIVGGSAGPSVTPLPMSPQVQAREARDNAAANRDDIRTGIQARGEQRDIGYHDRDFARQLRSDFGSEQAVKDYSKAMPIFVQGLKTGNTPQGSTSLIYAYATIMDPSSSVREGEADTVGNADTIFGQARAFAEKQLDNTGTFSPEARNGLIREMRSKMIELNRAYTQTRQRYSVDAESFGVNPEQIIGPHVGQPFLPELDEIDRREGRGQYAEQEIAADQPEAGYDEERGLYGGRVTDDSPPPEGGGYAQSPVSQGMSGVNEGLAGTLGLPFDITGLIDTGITRGINGLFGTDLKTADEAYQQPTLGGSQWWQDHARDAGLTGPAPTTDTGAFLRRTGQSVGASLMPLGGATSLPKLGMGMLASAGGGAGAATAQQVFPDNPLAEFVGEMFGSGATGLGAMGIARNRAQNAIHAAVPTVDDLKTQAGNLYARAEANGVTADPALTQQLADDFRTTLRREGQLGPNGRITNADTSTTKALNLVEQYEGQPMTPTEMNTVRGVVAEGRNSQDAADQRLARILTDQFDQWTDPMAPEFRQARDVASRYLQAEDLEQARELANVEASKFTGSGLENALRTQYRGLDRNSVKGKNWFSPDVTDAIEAVSRGTTGSNLARAAGRFAPTGVVSAALGTGGPAALGYAIGGLPLGLAIGTGAAAIGTGGRLAATRMGLNAATRAEMIARNGGPLQQAALLDPDIMQAAALAASGQLGQYVEPANAQQGEGGGNPQPLPRRERQQPRRRGLLGSR